MNEHYRSARSHMHSALMALDALGQQMAIADLATELHLWITPSRRSGDVCIGGTDIRAVVVAERVWAEGVETAMADWDLSRHVVLMACWWWALHNPPPRWATKGDRFGEWIEWADGYSVAHHHGNTTAPWPKDEIPDPPGGEW